MAIYKWSVVGHYPDGVQVVNTLHYRTVPPPLGDEPAADDVLTGIDEHIQEAYRQCMAGSWHADSTNLVEIVAPGSFDVPRAASFPWSQTGVLTGGNASLPEALTMILALKTDVARRWARGYMALPSPLNQTYVDASGNWTGGFVTAATALAALLDDTLQLGSVAITDCIPIVYSRTQHGLGNPSPFATVKAGIPRLKPKWRRSRLTSP